LRDNGYAEPETVKGLYCRSHRNGPGGGFVKRGQLSRFLYPFQPFLWHLERFLFSECCEDGELLHALVCRAARRSPACNIYPLFFLEQLPDRRIYFWRELSLAKEKDAVAVKTEAEKQRHDVVTVR
jgi:hypothetical protein